MTHAKPRHDSIAPTKGHVRAATGQSLIPAPAQAPPEEAGAAYASVQAEFDAMPEDVVEPRHVDASAAAVKACQLADDVRSDKALVGRFRKVAESGEFAMRSLEALGTYGLALWYVAYRQGTGAPKSGARIPAATKRKAMTLRARMQKLARYHFGEHDAEGPLVSSLVQLRGDQGLGQALMGLAELYARRPAIVAGDTTNYRDTDEAEARSLSATLLALPGTDHSRWAARTSRAWTLLLRAYDDVRATGLWILRATPEEAARRFPSLIAESRATAKPRKVTPNNPITNPQSADVTPTGTAPAAPKRRRRRTR